MTTVAKETSADELELSDIASKITALAADSDSEALTPRDPKAAIAKETEQQEGEKTSAPKVEGGDQNLTREICSICEICSILFCLFVVC